MSAHHALGLSGIACDGRSAVRALDPRAKLLGLLTVTLVAVSTPLRAWPVWVACAAVLAAYARAGRVPVGILWRRWRLVLAPLLAAAALVPFARPGGAAHALGPLAVHEGGLQVAATVAAKAAIGTLSAVLLGATATFPEVLRGLQALRVPSLLVLVAASMYRYLFVIADEAGRMRAAVRARGFRPRTAFGAGATGRVAAALFLRAHGRGERVHRAMLARGFRGSVPDLLPLALRRADLTFVALVLAALVPLRVVG
jgi:cobalt/nickel transport system permease protein